MKKKYYIDYPQEHLEGELHKYRCVFCKVETTTINGKLEGHQPSCAYRMQLENVGYEATGLSEKLASYESDDFD